MVEKSLVWRCGFLQARFQLPEAALPKSSICLGNPTNQKLESLLRTWRGYPWQITALFPCAAYNEGLTLRSGFWVPKQGDVVRYKPIWSQYETHMLNFGTTSFGVVVTHEMVAVGGAMRGRDADWVSATAVLLVDTYSKQSQTLMEKVLTSFAWSHNWSPYLSWLGTASQSMSRLQFGYVLVVYSFFCLQSLYKSCPGWWAPVC